MRTLQQVPRRCFDAAQPRQLLHRDPFVRALVGHRGVNVAPYSGKYRSITPSGNERMIESFGS